MKSKSLFFLISLIISFLSMSLSFSSCKDDNDSSPKQEKPIKPDYTTTAKTSVYGFITDENDQPLVGATVTANETVVTSDEYGYFEIPEADLPKDIAFVTAKKDGYFNGIRTWQATENVEQIIRIKLLPKTIVGSITASDGGEITTTKGVKLTFPKNAVTTSDGAAYTGKVNVAIQWLNPMDADFGETMPGDLSAVNSNGNLRTLISYGMVGAELTDESGNILKVADNTDIKMTTPIPTDLLSIAPASMPLWSFDETKGVWAEEGVTNKVGNEYVGNVRHFSWWNCDKQEGWVELTCHFTNSEGKPMSGIKIKLKSLGNGYTGTCYTNNAGSIRKRIPSNTSYELAAYSPISDDCFLTGMSFTVEEEDIDLGTFTVSEDKEVTITGSVLECDDTNASGNAYYWFKGNLRNIIPIVDGKYSITTPVCDKVDLNLIVLSTSKHEKKITITSNESTLTVPNFVNECREVTITGVVNACPDDMGGRVTFKSDFRELQTEVNDSYKFSFKIPYTRSRETGTLTIYNKAGEIDYNKEITVAPDNTYTYSVNRIEPIKLTGTVNGCDNKPLANGSVMLVSSYYHTSAPVTNGVYSITFNEPIRCAKEDIMLIVTDNETLAKEEVNTTMSPGNNTVATITVCDGGGTSMENHIFVEYDGKSISFLDGMYGFSSSGTDVQLGGNAYYEPENTDLRMVLYWNATSLKVGTFDINENSFYSWNKRYTESGSGILSGKVTLTIAQKAGDNMTVRGTFTGKIKIHDEDSGKDTTKDISGSFFYNGRDWISH